MPVKVSHSHHGRESLQDGSSDLPQNEGKLERRLFDTFKGGPNGFKKLGAQARPLGLIPERRLEGIRFRLRAHLQAAHLARLAQTPLKTFEYFLPGTSVERGGAMHS